MYKLNITLVLLDSSLITIYVTFVQAHLRDTAGSLPDHRNKANIAMK